MPRPKRKDKKGAPGLYRSWRPNKATGKMEPSGAFVIEIKIPTALRSAFAGMPMRIKRSTGVMPGARNAAGIVKEMKIMIREIIFSHNLATMRLITNGEVALPTLYAKYKSGTMHLVEPHENKPLVKEWRAYLDRAKLANRTRTNRKAVIEALLRKQLIDEKDVVAQIPERLKAMRDHYERTAEHSAFNTYRMEILTFLTKGLGFHDDSQLLHATSRVKQLPQQKRRPHHPFVSPRDMAAFCAKLQARGTPSADLYVRSVHFMCTHGLRPEEFAGRRFRVDPKTGHLKIDGTKNENADRLAPIFEDPSLISDPPRVDTLNRMFERMGTDTRCRDFRRTYSIWLERAGVLPSHIRQYLGHGDTSVTHTYQRMIPTADQMDADAAKLLAWINAELMQRAPKRQQPELLSHLQRMRMAGNKLPRLRKAAVEDQRQVRRSRQKHHEADD